MFGYRTHRVPTIWQEMERLTRDMNRLVQGTQGAARAGRESSVYPPLNLYDNGEAYVVRAEVPGIDPETLELHTTAEALVLKGERKRPEVDDAASYHRRERDFGVFNRTITLPKPINADKVMANYNLGVLEIVLPKADEAMPRRIKVN